MMTCPKCGSEEVNAQMVSETQLKEKHRSVFWWIFIGWWWLPIKWIGFALPALIVKIFAPKRYKTTTSHKTMWVCQKCGWHWEA